MSLPETLAMVRIAHTRFQVVLCNLVVRYHPPNHNMDVFSKERMEMEMELEEYYLWDQGMNPKLPALLNPRVQICLSDWFERHWKRGERTFT